MSTTSKDAEDHTLEEIRGRARARVAKAFGLSANELPLKAEFGKDLDASFVSNFRFNEFDRLDFDIRDVADRATLRRLEDGSLMIRTVADYCEHMVACYATNPREVLRLLDLQDDGIRGRPGMSRGLTVLVKSATVVALATSLIGAVYIIVFPRFSPGLTTGTPLIIGLVACALAAGRVAWNEASGGEDNKFCWALMVGSMAAAATLFISLGLIVSFLGS